ncbi:MAG: hypothetical protein J7M19_08150 [Planctomycetes bacterium]|nr:hypothetical protein [Planctomycetota bacterium]
MSLTKCAGYVGVLAVLLFAAPAAVPAEAPQPSPVEKAEVSEAVPKTAAAKAPAAPTAIAVTVDELKQLLKRKEQPRVQVANKFGGSVTGKAVRIDKRKLFVDVGGESVAIGGVMAVNLSRIVSIKILVPLSDAQRKAVREATAKYIGGIKTGAPKAQAQPPEAPSAEGPASEPAESVSPKPSEAPEQVEQAAEERDLLAIYPPAQGWGPEKLGDIVRKRVVVHIQPSGKDRTFLKDYDAWREAYIAKRNEQMETKAAMKGMGKELPADFEILPELKSIPTLAGSPPGYVGEESPQDETSQ